MTDHTSPNPDRGMNDRSIDWSRQPVAARLRALADDELPPDAAVDLRVEADAESIARADTFERRLRERCADCMKGDAAPQDLRERVLEAMRRDGEEATVAQETTPPHVQDDNETPAVYARTDRSFWSQGRALVGIAAVLALVAGVWIFAPSAQGPEPGATLAQATQHISSEHQACTLDPEYFTSKVAAPAGGRSEEVGSQFITEQIGDLPVRLALGHAGYTLAGVGECHLPGPGKSVHLLYEPVQPEKSRPISLFIQEASAAQEWMSEGAVYTSGQDTPPFVRVWREADAVYYMVTECPVSCEKAEAAYALSGKRVPL